MATMWDTFENGTRRCSIPVTHGALIREEDRILFRWCFRTYNQCWIQPLVISVVSERNH